MRIALFLDLASVAVPTLVMGGGSDGMAPPEQMRELAAAIPGSRMLILPETGHLLNLEQPEAFDAALRSFLLGQDGGTHRAVAVGRR